MTTCNAYNCKAITTRQEWLDHKDNATDKNTCDTNCWPQNLYACYNDGQTPPSPQITTLDQWNTLKATLPATATLVDDPTKCTIPDLNKYYCTPNFDCGQIKTWDDYDKYGQYVTNDPNCDKCYPTGKFWCDQTNFTCNPINSRTVYLAHKDEMLDNCNDCYPKNESWCMDDYSTCDPITSYNQWNNIDKTTGSRTTDCTTCFPVGQYYCDDKKNCAEIETYDQYRKAKKPFYNSVSECKENCKKSGGHLLWFWIFLAILLIVAIIIGVYFYMHKKKSVSKSSRKI
jgi:hypothetical protein